MSDALRSLSPPKSNQNLASRLIAQNLTFSQGGSTLLHSISLFLEPGQSLAVIGASGSGKSTLLKLLVGTARPDSGQIVLDGKEQTPKQLQAKVGFVAQDDVLYPELSSEQSLEYLARMLRKDLSQTERIAEVDRILKLLELRNCARRPAKTLSGGQRKRLSIAMELLQNPTLFLLDEPLSNLDPALRRRFHRLFEKLCEEGLSLVVTTHQLEDLDSFDRVLVLDQGCATFFGAPEDLLSAVEDAGPGRDLFTLFSARSTAKETKAPQTLIYAPPEKWVSPHSLKRLLQQFPILCLRRAQRLSKEHRRLFTLLFQGPVIALFLSMALNSPVQIIFMAILTALWMGISASALEIVGERAVLNRERRLGVSVTAAFSSRWTVLALLTTLQCLFLMGILVSFHSIPISLPLFYGIIQASACTGLSLGFAVSANVKKAATAGLFIPLVMIPQVLFGGLFPLENRPSKIVERIVPARYAFDSAARISLLEGETLVDRNKYEEALEAWRLKQERWEREMKNLASKREKFELPSQLSKSGGAIKRLKTGRDQFEKSLEEQREKWLEFRSEMEEWEAESEDAYVRADRLRYFIDDDQEPSPNRAPVRRKKRKSSKNAKDALAEHRSWIDGVVDDGKSLLDGVERAKSRHHRWKRTFQSMERSNEETLQKSRGQWERELKTLERERRQLKRKLEQRSAQLEEQQSELESLLDDELKLLAERRKLESIATEGRIVETLWGSQLSSNGLALLGFNLLAVLMALLGMRRG